MGVTMLEFVTNTAEEPADADTLVQADFSISLAA
jgi:hypothetical protein